MKFIITLLSLTITLIPVSKDMGGHEASINEMVNAHSLAEPISQLKTKPIEPRVVKQTTPKPKAPTAKPVAVKTSSNADKAFIYQKESGNRLHAQNSGGCKGLGQDCNGQLIHACPSWRTDYACQDKFFTDYMQRRYKSWANAKAHWLARVPINGKDRGNWW